MAIWSATGLTTIASLCLPYVKRSLKGKAMTHRWEYCSCISNFLLLAFEGPSASTHRLLTLQRETNGNLDCVVFEKGHFLGRKKLTEKNWVSDKTWSATCDAATMTKGQPHAYTEYILKVLFFTSTSKLTLRSVSPCTCKGFDSESVVFFSCRLPKQNSILFLSESVVAVLINALPTSRNITFNQKATTSWK